MSQDGDTGKAQADETVPSGPPIPKFAQGRYLFQRLLGKGGMGVVWLARDERLETLVAIKILPDQVRMDPAALASLRRETSRSQKLSHPNIVRLHDLHEDDGGGAFITMEYVDGANLSALRCGQPGEVFTWDALVPIVRQLGEALAYAHGEKVIHRDLKPANLMVDAQGRLKLADFGIAAVVSDTVARVTGTTATSGTVAYMSPQQMKGETPRATDDIYALGATLYELLTGTPPFYTGEIYQQVLHKPASPLRQRLADLGAKNEIPPPVEQTILACLEKDPAKRPQSVREVAERLGLVELKTEARRMSFVVTATVAAALLIAGAFFWFGGSRGTQAASESSKLKTQVPGDERPGTSAATERVVLADNFERFEPDGCPLGWNKAAFAGVNRERGIIGIRQEGTNRFVRAEFGGSTTKISQVNLSRSLQVEPRWKRLKMSLRLRVSRFAQVPDAASGYAGALYSMYDKDNRVLLVSRALIWKTTTSGWTNLSEVIDVPLGTARMVFSPGLTGAIGSMDFDDLKITVVEEAPAPVK